MNGKRGNGRASPAVRGDKKPKREEIEDNKIEDGHGGSEKKSGMEEMESNKADLNALIQQYSKVEDILIRCTFNTANTTPEERQEVFKAAHLFLRRGPNTVAGPLPVALAGVAGLASYGDPGNEPTEIRFSGAMQVANWIADAQARGYAGGGPLVRFTIQLTSDNGGHWSKPFEALH